MEVYALTVPKPGVSEIGWLADLKALAEEVGSNIYGEPIRWEVEALPAKTRRRPDVVVRLDASGQVVGSGEAKRPDEPKGVHPLVATEVRDALEKAEIVGSPMAFTTNFFHIAVFDARKTQPYSIDLDRLQGGPIPLLAEKLAKAPDWWATLSNSERASEARLGLQQLFERLRLSTAAPIPREIDEATLLVFSRTTERLVGPLFAALIEERDSKGLQAKLIQHALTVHLLPQKDEEARYLVAQGVAEVLTAALFFRNIADHFSLDPLLRGTSPNRASVLAKHIRESLGVAVTRSGDYETIFGLSPAAEWVLRNGGGPVLQQWKDLFGFLEQLDFTSVSSDIIGSIFERLISPERRHAMGQHYTQPRVARAMSEWAVRAKSDSVADLACGAGTFLVEVYRCLTRFGLSHQAICGQTLGNEIDPFAAHLAAVNVATRHIYKGANYPAVRLGDAFDIRPGSLVVAVEPAEGDPVSIRWPSARLDAVVGNPPYAESPADVASLCSRLAELGCPVPPTMTGGNLAAWFAFLAWGLTKPEGRFALVMPTGVLQNSNLIPWRDWLRRNFDVVVWHTEDDVWFSDARVATCVILATRRPKGLPGSLSFADVHERISGELVSLDGVPTPSAKVFVRDLSGLPPADDILIAGTYPEALGAFAASRACKQLRDLESVSVYSGNKLGHECFQLKDEDPNKGGTIRSVEGFEMHLRLSAKYLDPLFASPKEERTGEFSASGTWVLSAPKKLPAKGAVQRYVHHCEKLGVHQSPSVSARGPQWWSVEWRTSQIAVQIHPGFLHQVWWSAKPFVAKNNFHILEFSGKVPQADRELIAASMASGFGALSALYISSEVGCEGVRWLSSEQFAQWPVLDRSKVSATDRQKILDAYREFRRLPAVEIHQMDAEGVEAWRALTAAVARAAGVKAPDALARKVLDVARQTCVRRTEREKIALAGRTRAVGGRSGAFAKYVREKLAAAPGTVSVLEQLTEGENVVRLRSEDDFTQGTLDFGDGEGKPFPGEVALSRVLGARFECAPVVESEDPEALASTVEDLLSKLVVDVIGPPPSVSDPAFKTYDENRETVRRHALSWVQKEVRKRLD